MKDGKPPSVEEMDKLGVHSDEWYEAAFHNLQQPDAVLIVAQKLTKAYGIKGQADPGYFANVIGNDTGLRELLSAAREFISQVPPYTELYKRIVRLRRAADSVQGRS